MKVTLNIPKPTVKTFKVKGETIADVRDALQRRTEWGSYNSNQTGDWSGKTELVDTVKLGARPVIEMPDWSGYSKADKAAKKEWDRMFKALKAHEDEHHDAFVTVCEAFRKDVEKGGDLKARDMQDTWDQFMKDVQKAQDKLDSSTRHGQNDGVELND